MKKRAWAKRVPKQNINYLHYNYINFFTTTTTTATILCVMDQRLLWCEHCKRTFFERLRCLAPLLWNLTSRCEIEKLCHFQEREREKKKCCAHCYYSFGVSKLKYKFCVVLPIRESSPVIILPWFFSSRDQIISSITQFISKTHMPNKHYLLSGILYTQFIRRNSSSDYFFSCQTLNVYKRNLAY